MWEFGENVGVLGRMWEFGENVDVWGECGSLERMWEFGENVDVWGECGSLGCEGQKNRQTDRQTYRPAVII